MHLSNTNLEIVAQNQLKSTSLKYIYTEMWLSKRKQYVYELIT